MYRDYIKGLGVFVCCVVAFLILKEAVTDVNAYFAARYDQKMEQCIANGNTWNLCYAVIYQGRSVVAD